MKAKEFLLSILSICIVTILPHFDLIPVPFGYCIPVILLIWLYLKYNGERFSDIGFRLKSLSFKSFLVGSLAAIGILLFLQFVFFPALEYFIKLQHTDVELYRKLKDNTGFYIFIMAMGWVVGGLYEEIVFHGFIFTRLEKIIPGKYSTTVSFICTAIIFGLYHLQLGTEGVINALLAGAGYHALILFHKRNLWYGIFCHAVFDTIAITLLYLGYL